MSYVSNNIPQVVDDSRLEKWEIQTFLDKLAQEIKNNGKVKVDGTTYDKTTDSKWKDLKSKLLKKAAKVAEPKEQTIKKPAEFKKLRLKILSAKDKFDALNKKINDLQEKKKKSKLNAQETKLLARMKAERSKTKKRLKTMINVYEASNDGKQPKLKASVKKGIIPENTKKTSGKASSSSPKAATTGKGAKAAKAGTPRSGNAQPTSGKAQTLPNIGPKFDSLAFQQAMGMESAMMSSWDDIYSNQDRGKKLMMLMLYVMRMAMSGDMFAQVMLLRVITQIIGMDKARQNVLMSKKLIQLQKASREVTEKLMNTETSADATSQNDFTKMLQWAKSESDSIATSQKLIAQMMEEFTHVKSSLESLTKSATTKWGQTMSYLSRF